MSDLFTRNIQNIRNIEDQSFKTNDVNDLLEQQDGKHYIRRRKDYHCLTDNIKLIHTNAGDLSDPDNNEVTLPNYVRTASKNGRLLEPTDTGLLVIGGVVESVNDVKPDSTGNVVIPTGGGSVAIAQNFHDFGQTTWIVRLNQGIDLSTTNVTVEQVLADGIKVSIPDSFGVHIDVNKTNDYTNIEYTLSDDYKLLCGKYVMTIEITGYEPVNIKVINPLYNSNAVNDQIVGIIKPEPINNNLQLKFTSSALPKLITENTLTLFVNDTQTIPAQETDDFVALDNLTAGLNNVTLKNGDTFIWSTVINYILQ